VKKHLLARFPLAILASILPGTLADQVTTATISGTVRDSRGAVFPTTEGMPED